MKIIGLSILTVAAVALASCEGSTSAPGEGRYAGIGIHSAAESWSKMVAPGQSSDPAAAKLSDDENIIVVVDSRTGEVRQCGDMSGYCISMKPWAKDLSPEQAAPVKLTEHVGAAASAPAGKAEQPVR